MKRWNFAEERGITWPRICIEFAPNITEPEITKHPFPEDLMQHVLENAEKYFTSHLNSEKRLDGSGGTCSTFWVDTFGPENSMDLQVWFAGEYIRIPDLMDCAVRLPYPTLS